jgi:hypothetical protein
MRHTRLISRRRINIFDGSDIEVTRNGIQKGNETKHEPDASDKTYEVERLSQVSKK